MTDGVRPIDPVRGRDRRDAQRRSTERRKIDPAPDAPSKAIVRVQEVIDEVDHSATPAAPPSASWPRATGPDPAFAAQLIGQGGQRKGIRGGPPVMEAARSAYLGNEYSGENDRRPPAGVSKKTDI